MWMFYLIINLLVIETNTLSILFSNEKVKLTGVRSLHCQDPCKSGLLLFKPIHSQRWLLCEKAALSKFEHNNWQKYLAFTMSEILRTWKFIQKTCH